MNNLAPGTVVSVNVGPIKHFGIVSDKQWDGMPYIISNSLRAGQVAEEPANIFANGNTIRKVDDYPGKMNPYEVIARARSQLGKTYKLISWNCEHFIRWVHGQKVESPQLQAAAIVGGLSLLALLYFKKNK